MCIKCILHIFLQHIDVQRCSLSIEKRRGTRNATVGVKSQKLLMVFSQPSPWNVLSSDNIWAWWYLLQELLSAFIWGVINRLILSTFLQTSGLLISQGEYLLLKGFYFLFFSSMNTRVLIPLRGSTNLCIHSFLSWLQRQNVSQFFIDFPQLLDLELTCQARMELAQSDPALPYPRHGSEVLY